MSLKIEIYLTEETMDSIEDVESVITPLGDILSLNYGNVEPEGDFDLKNLKSFIIIKDEELPRPENFENEDMYFIIPIKDEK